jgi:hypothetical protein
VARTKVRYIFAVIFAISIAISCVIIGKRWLTGRFIAVDVIKNFTFSGPGALDEWKPKGFKGRTIYTIESSEGESYVKAVSDATASALFYKIKVDMARKPILSWKWRVIKFPDKKGKEDLKSAKKDDFGARIYVIFPSFMFTNTRALEYIWTKGLKEGDISASPYSKNLQLFVAQSGEPKDEEWVYEERDVYADYLKVFGEAPKKSIGAIAIMADADSTKSTAEAVFDDIRIGYKKEEGVGQ